MKRLLWYLGCVPILLASIAVASIQLVLNRPWGRLLLDRFKEWCFGPADDPMGGQP